MNKKLLVPIAVLGAVIALLTIAPKLAAASYKIKGIDISHHQGHTDWDALALKDINFVYIKATEGSSLVDEELHNNYVGAAGTDIYYGFYLFVRFDSEPEAQFENFQKATEGYDMKLIPALDVEWYGDKRDNPPSKELVLSTVDSLAGHIEEEYGVKPVIYTTQSFYFKYFFGENMDYPLWIRNVYWLPFQKWTIWQYTDKLDLSDCFESGDAVDGDVTNADGLKAITPD